jgi:Ran GTPase-activating protein (RanGAP) involved in mRNA processing and transport
MQMLDLKSICALARCNKSLNSDAQSRFALATQDRFSIASHQESAARPDAAFSAPGLLQYHPEIRICGPWKTLKRIPGAIMRGMVHLDVHSPIGLAKGLEEVFASMSRLRELSISHVVKSGTTVRLFRALGERERVDGAQGLQTLYVGQTIFGKEATDQFSAYLADAGSLETLTLHNCSFKRDYLQSLVNGLVQNRTITVFELDGCSLGLNSEVALSKILRGCPTLTALDLSYTHFGNLSGQLEALADAILDGNCNLKSLSANGNSFCRHGARAIAPTISKLQKLEISNNSIWDDDIRAIGEAIGSSKTITNLSINNNYGLAFAIESFSAGIASNKSLQILEIFHCHIGAAGLQHLSAALVGKKELRELYLYDNSIVDDGCQYVAEILVGCPSLEVLQLSVNQFGSAGVRTLATALSRATSLQKLVMYGIGYVDDPSAAALFEAAHGHPSLSRIAVAEDDWNFQIGELATAKLENLRPGLVKRKSYAL